MRSLTVDEIVCLESHGCVAEDWARISVADDFEPAHVSNVTFVGDVSLGVFDKSIEVCEGLSMHTGISHAVLSDVSIGDNCLIANIGSHIHRYDIGDDCAIINVGSVASTEAATYGLGTTIAAPSEGGAPCIVLYSGLTAQMAALMVDAAASDEGLRQRLVDMASRRASEERPSRGAIGYGVRIVGAGDITNAWIGDGCEVNGATRLSECTLAASADAGIYIGADVVMENCVAQPGASAVDGARLYNCLIGEACHAGRGFTAESTLLFANSYMDNGEACAAICGPFTVSHHKASLLIGTQTAFYNAGSATNYSNHAYKLGPLHSGTLARGSKTGSGAHIILPARIGAFSVCLGKIESHPDTSQLPFSYIIGAQHSTLIVPGRNLMTVGLWRDVAKWPKRDMRPRLGRTTIVNYDWLNPAVAEAAMQGKALLEATLMEQGVDAGTYTVAGCEMSRRWLDKGVEYYDTAIKLYMGEAIKGHFCELPEVAEGVGAWRELGAMLAPASLIDDLTSDIIDGSLCSVADIEERFAAIHSAYAAYKWSYTYQLLKQYYHLDTLTADDMERVEDDYRAAQRLWKSAVKDDARRDHALGDVADDILDSFISQISEAES